MKLKKITQLCSMLIISGIAITGCSLAPFEREKSPVNELVETDDNYDDENSDEQELQVEQIKGWTSDKYGIEYTRDSELKNQVAIDNDVMKITFEGKITADEFSIKIPYIIENKTDKKISIYNMDAEMDGATLDITGTSEVNAKTKTKDTFHIQRESLINNNLESLDVLKCNLSGKVGSEYIKNYIYYEVDLR